MSKFELVNVLADGIYPGSVPFTAEIIDPDPNEDASAILVGRVEDPQVSEGNLGFGLSVWLVPSGFYEETDQVVDRSSEDLTVTPQLV